MTDRTYTQQEIESTVADIERVGKIEQAPKAAAMLRQLLDERRAAEDGRDTWEETARRAHGDIRYYQGLLDRIGDAFGPESRVADSGDEMDSVLRAKLPDMATRLAAELADLRAYRQRREAEDDARAEAETERLRDCGNLMYRRGDELMNAIQASNPALFDTDPTALPFQLFGMALQIWNGRKGGDYEVDLRTGDAFKAFVEKVRRDARDAAKADHSPDAGKMVPAAGNVLTEAQAVALATRAAEIAAEAAIDVVMDRNVFAINTIAEYIKRGEYDNRTKSKTAMEREFVIAAAAVGRAWGERT